MEAMDSPISSILIFGNPVILCNIFSSIPIKDLLPLRSVSHCWKEIADEIISKTFPITLAPNREDKFSKDLAEHLQYYESLNLSALNLKCSQISLYNLTVLFYLRKIAKQIQTLKITNLPLRSEYDFVVFETIISAFPNLKQLYVFWSDINTPMFLKFKLQFAGKCEAIVFKCDNELTKVENPEKLVLHLSKIFPKLEKRFSNKQLDAAWFQHLIKNGRKNEEILEITSVAFPLDTTLLKDCLNLIEQRIFSKLRSFTIKIDFTMETCGELFTRTLAKLGPSLVTLRLFFQRDGGNNVFTNSFVLNVPPLKKLRELEATIPPIIQNDELGTPCFTWKFGNNSVAKDFPSLEKLEFYREQIQYCRVKWDDYKLPESWEIWESLLPLLGNGGEDLTTPPSKLRHLKIEIPDNWVGKRENIFWGKSFLKVFNKLYGNVGSQVLAPNMSKWNAWLGN